MAGDWIKFEHVTPDKPEVDRMAMMLGIEHDAVVGKLLRFWIWADQQSVSCNGLSVTKKLIDRVTHQSGFADALISSGWLHEDESGFSIPGFDRHNGQTAKSRAESNRRVAQHRKDKSSDKSERLSIPRPIRESILKRDGGACVYCKRIEGQYFPPETKADSVIGIDHVIPLSRGGNNSPENLVACCAVCNNFKNNRTPDECQLTWPVDSAGKRFGNELTVTEALPEKRREENTNSSPVPARAGIPKLSDALEFSETQMGWEKSTVNAWFADRSAQGWVRANGLPVTNWRADLESWILREATGNAPGGRKHQSEKSQRTSKFSWH